MSTSSEHQIFSKLEGHLFPGQSFKVDRQTMDPICGVD